MHSWFANPKTESFRLLCQLHYLQFGFQIYRSIPLQMLFQIGSLKNFATLEFLSNKVTGLQAFNFVKKIIQHKCFSVKFVKSLRAYSFTEHFRWLLLEISCELCLYCIWKWWIVPLHGTYWHSSAFFIFLSVFRFFLLLSFFLSFCGFYYSLRYCSMFVNT